jgi:hypothetical protein
MSDVDKTINRIFELAGGKDQFFVESEKDRSAYISTWEQNIDEMGRVLRAHTVVEYHLTGHIEAENEGIVDLHESGLMFHNKIMLLDKRTYLVKQLLPGLRMLNQIRNRFAHNLNSKVTEDDKNAFYSVEIFTAMEKAFEDRWGEKGKEPLEVLENFADFAARMFHATTSKTGKYWRQAIGEDIDGDAESIT